MLFCNLLLNCVQRFRIHFIENKLIDGLIFDSAPSTDIIALVTFYEIQLIPHTFVHYK